MRGIVLAATHETKLTASGQRVPLPLVDIVDEPYLTTLCKRLAKLPRMAEIMVVTNDAIFGDLQLWAKSNIDIGVSVQVVSDGTLRPEDRKGAVGDILFLISEAHLDDDLFIVGGDNWFTYDLDAFAKEAQTRSPAVAVTEVTTGARPSRFGWVEMDDDARIVRFLEHPDSTRSDEYLKASCVYYLANGDLHWLKSFADTESTRCSPGTFFAWMVERTDVFGVKMASTWHERGSRGPDALAFREIVRKFVSPQYSTWERQAAKDLEWASSHADLVDALEDQDPNKRIVAARLLGHARDKDERGEELLSKDGVSMVTSALIRHLDDQGQNLIDGGGGWQDDEDEPPTYVSRTAANALVRLGYAESAEAVIKKAQATGFQFRESD